MRITESERKVFIEAALSIDPDARLWLFGSRTDDGKKGGDIDLAILSPKIDRSGLSRIRRAILDAIGEQHIDLVLSKDGKDAFFRLAVQKGVLLNE